MRNLFTKGIGLLLIISLLALAGCQDSDSSEDKSKANKTKAATEEKASKEKEDHNHDDDKHSHSHNHNHSHGDDEDAEEIYKGYFEDSQIEDRALSDWEGDWQSVYSYLEDGALDEVFAHKAKQNKDMTSEEYKEYYNKGYKTDVDHIKINGDNVTFAKNGKNLTGEYLYDGYEILTYEKGNRGVRSIFKLTEKVEGLPQYIQFSDHNIYPTKADHFHLYWGDDRKALLDEVLHWPTYYPVEMDGHDIAEEMMAH